MYNICDGYIHCSSCLDIEIGGQFRKSYRETNRLSVFECPYNYNIGDTPPQPLITRGSVSFVMTVKTDNVGQSEYNQFILPLKPGEYYNCMIDWGDLTTERLINNNNSSIIHSYGSPGVYVIKILGVFPAICFDASGDKDKLMDILRWGRISWTTMESAFRGCSNVRITAQDSPNLTRVTNMSRMFDGACIATPDVSEWDVSNVVNMSHLFDGAVEAIPDVSGWDVSNVVNMNSMFANMKRANPNISKWNTRNVVDMGNMFRGSMTANPDISNLDTRNVVQMTGMFDGASSANPKLSKLNIEKLSSAKNICVGANLSSENYDDALMCWEKSGRKNININVSPTKFTERSKNSRTILINDRSWKIFDGGPA